MHKLIVAILTILPLQSAADGLTWTQMTGDDIRNALTDRVLSYGDTWQDFRSSGRTLYNSGPDSWGYWRVQDDQYCSQWPPSDLWVCYKMERRGDALRFVGADGDVIEGLYDD